VDGSKSLFKDCLQQSKIPCKDKTGSFRPCLITAININRPKCLLKIN
jgi:hypothetical protein